MNGGVFFTLAIWGGEQREAKAWLSEGTPSDPTGF